MNPYSHFVAEFARLIKEGRSHPLGGIVPAPRPEIAADAPKALIFSPHPDDECIIGALALRLLQQARMKVINVAVTLGSKKERRDERLDELENACYYLGLGLIESRPDGLEKVNLKTREQEPAFWAESVRVISEILKEHRPSIIFFPHEHDWNSTHIGTHFLVLDTLKTLGNDLEMFAVETEFWGQMQTPNLMVESSAEDVADMVTGISFHVGEVRRNPYHVLLPAWLLDNVRRGAELVGGQGAVAPDFAFATLYRLRRWKNGRLELIHEGGRHLSTTENPKVLFGVD